MSNICKYFSLFGTRFSKVYGIKEYGFGPSVPRIFVSRCAVPLHGCGARDHLWCKFQCDIYIYIYLLLVQNGMDLGRILQSSYAFDPLRYRYVSNNCYMSASQQVQCIETKFAWNAGKRKCLIFIM